jgi:hypothetical protein
MPLQPGESLGAFLVVLNTTYPATASSLEHGVETRVGAVSTASVASTLADLNADGLDDLVVDGLAYMNPPESPGDFTNVVGTRLGTHERTFTSVATADVNGDQALDLVLAFEDLTGTQGVELLLNPGNGDFSSVAAIAVPGTTSSASQIVKLADMNQDGKPDLIVGKQNEANQLFVNPGDGSFGITGFEVLPFGARSDDTRCLAVGDVNQDGQVDIVVGNLGQPNRVYLATILNSDLLSFSTMNLGEEADESLSIQTGDVNGDGLPDVVVGNRLSQNVLHLAVSAGVFGPPSSIGGEADDTRSIVINDLNLDGLLDVVVGNGQHPNKVYINPSTGDFSSTVAQPVGIDAGDYDTLSIEVGKLNSDGEGPICSNKRVVAHS